MREVFLNDTIDSRQYPAGSGAWTSAAWIGAIAVVYFLAARLSLTFNFEPEGIAAIWPPSGIFLSAILLTRRDLRAPLVGVLFVTDLAAELLNGTPFLVSSIYAGALTMDAVLSSWLLLRFVNTAITFNRVRDVLGFLVAAVFLSNAIASCVAGAAGALIPRSTFWSSWKWWFTADGVGNLLITPLVLSFSLPGERAFERWNAKRVVEAVALFTLLLVSNYIVFHLYSDHSQFILLALTSSLPLLLWAAMRFELRGLAGALVVLAVVAIQAVQEGHAFNIAPLVFTQLDTIVVVQLYLALIAIPSLLLTAVTAERRQAERALRRSEELYRKLISASPDGITIVGLDGRISYLSPKALDMYGEEKEEDVVGRSPLEWIAPEFREKALTNITNVFKEIYSSDNQYCLMRRDGTRFWGEINAAVLTDSLGKPAGMIATTRDVTTRKQAEEEHLLSAEALRESENKYRQVVETASDIIFTCNLAGYFTYANRAGLEAVGCTLDELRGFNYLDLVTPDHQDRVKRSYFRQYLAQEPTSTIEFPFHTRGGSVRWFSQRATLELQGGRPVGFHCIARDITEQKSVEAALRESEERNRAIVQHAAEGIAVYDLEQKRLLDFNPAQQEMLGYTADEMRRLDLYSVVVEDRANIDRCVEQVKQARHLTIGKRKYRRSDGTFLNVEVSSSVIVYGGRQAITIIARDITERERFEQELYELHAQYRQALTQAQAVPYLRMYARPEYSFVGEEIAKYTGYAAGEFVPSLWNELRQEAIMLGECTGLTMEEAGRRVRAGILKHWLADYRIRTREGRIRWINDSSVPITDGNGNVIGALGVLQDITERKRSEEELRRAELSYRELFNENLAGLFISTPEGRLRTCNPAYVRIFGFQSLEEAMEADLSVLYRTKSQRDEFLELLRHEGRLMNYQQKLIRRDGSPVYVVENVLGKFDDDGNLAEIHGYLVDETKRRELEQALIQSQKLDSLGTLAGGIAHDFNNILNIILGHSELLKRGHYDPTKTARRIEAIVKAAHRGTAVVRQLLTFARKTEPVTESVRLNEIVDEVLKLVKETFSKTIRLEANLKHDLPSVVADADQIHQVVLNLCVNARDAMPEGGTLMLSTGVVHGEDVRRTNPKAEAGEYVLLRIADTGTGMDESVRQRIFEPFFTTKESGKGTGLGLAVVFGIVDAHNGFIEVESEPGKGTVFIIYLPAQRGPSLAEPVAGSLFNDVPGGRETILIVEDEEMVHEFLETTLSSKGYRVLIARDGIEALTMYQLHREELDLIISDIGLPTLGGDVVFRRIREHDPGTKIILVTGYLSPELKDTLHRAGAMHFIKKPYSSQEVLQMVRDVLDDAA